MPQPSTPGNGNGSNGEMSESLRSLLKAGLELGVAEAVRRVALLAPPGSERLKRLEVEGLLGAALVSEFVAAVRQDSTSVFQLVKEVWSRGGVKERKTAARALGHGLNRIAPHKALGLSRELAAMARSQKEADVVGAEAIGPILEANPSLYDRVKQFLKDSEPWVRRAAIAGLVAYVSRQKKLAGLTVEAILLLAEHHDKEIKSAVRWSIRELSRVDWRATGKAITDWARTDPARVKLAKQYAAATAESVRKDVERAVFVQLAKFADAAPKPRGA